MSISVLYPTLGLMMPFLRDAEWAVALTRAYNTMPQAIQWVGDDRIFYASDFPHWDHSYPKSVKELADRADLTDVQKRRILADNARRFYALA